jgi:tetratricopeptide (TPR) repeat protein
MPTIFFEILLLIFTWKPSISVSDLNKLKVNSNYFYNHKNFKMVELSLRKVLLKNDSEPEVLANLANVLFLQNKKKEAIKIYSTIQTSTDLKVAVQANLHLGIYYSNIADTLKAINQFENALRRDSKNDIARYNVELLKKRYSKKMKPANQQNNIKNQKNIDFAAAKSNLLDPKANKTEVLARLTKINLTENQVKNIFEGIGKNQVKYIQQNKQKSSTKAGEFMYW